MLRYKLDVPWVFTSQSFWQSSLLCLVFTLSALACHQNERWPPDSHPFVNPKEEVIVTMFDFNKISEDMPIEEVTKAIGYEGILKNSYQGGRDQWGRYRVHSYEWRNGDGSVLSVTAHSGSVASVYQTGLPQVLDKRPSAQTFNARYVGDQYALLENGRGIRFVDHRIPIEKARSIYDELEKGMSIKDVRQLCGSNGILLAWRSSEQSFFWMTSGDSLKCAFKYTFLIRKSLGDLQSDLSEVSGGTRSREEGSTRSSRRTSLSPPSVAAKKEVTTEEGDDGRAKKVAELKALQREAYASATKKLSAGAHLDEVRKILRSDGKQLISSHTKSGNKATIRWTLDGDFVIECLFVDGYLVEWK